ncbi:MFS general substrate transporter [Athelia psychrophila]|uniref:MFS general substrate transporter n=1 Tax=Athelia psychrophila TaxID=1759441 RepID=A0A166VWZ0_9AGAM|nr:MFS general substrate transporter [Fibularhizoctonia sp. CBS 109695]
MPDDTHSASRDEEEKASVGGSTQAPAAEAAPPEFLFETSNPFFVRDLAYTREEEARVIRILDTRLLPWVLLTTFVLNMDRTNLSNAVSDGLPADLGFTINVVNTGTAIYSVLFSIACLSGSVVAKKLGPAPWIAILMFAWGLVTLAHAAIKDKAGYLTVIAITEGGVIPATLVYLGAFYKSTELATRLAFFWGVQSISSAISGLMAAGLLRLAGVGGLEGWKWLFLVDGIITLFIALMTWFYLPRGVDRTKGGLRGFNPWFTEREIQIANTRVIRDDPAKRNYESEKTVTWVDVKSTLLDVGVWGHLIITMVGLTPTSPLATYLPTVIKSFHFDVYVSNALTAPPYILQCATSVFVIWHADRVRERGYHGAFAATWQLVGWILLRTLPADSSKGVRYFAALITAAWPTTHPLNIAWMTENTGTVGTRTIASGLIIGSANIYGVWGSQIYQADDSPYFKTGNTINIVFAGTAVCLWIAQKFYYRHLNARHRRQWEALSERERRQVDEDRDKEGSKSVSFTFTT